MAFILLVDSREQAPLNFFIGEGEVVKAIETVCLSFGDYAAMTEEGVTMPVSFERKSLSDLFGTLTSGMERFKKEIARAKAANATLYIIIEGSISDVLNGIAHSSVSGEQILKTLNMLRVKHGVDHIFCNNRAEMKNQIVHTFWAIERNWKKESKLI